MIDEKPVDDEVMVIKEEKKRVAPGRFQIQIYLDYRYF